jgi:hypothetical protein
VAVSEKIEKLFLKNIFFKKIKKNRRKIFFKKILEKMFLKKFRKKSSIDILA